MQTVFFTLINNLHPGLIMIVMGILVMLLPKICRYPLSILAALASLGSIFLLDKTDSLIYKFTENLSIEFLNYDKLTLPFLLVFAIISLCNAIYSLRIQTKLEMGMSMVYVGMIFGIILAGDPISLIIFWEGSAIASTYMVYAGGTKEAKAASFRYFLVHAFGGNLLLAGLLVYLFRFGNTFENISSYCNEPFFYLVLIGAMVNAAVPPLNSWLTDAYPEASPASTLYLGSFTTKAAIFVLIKLFAGTEILVWIGAAMAIYAALMAILENDIRRLLCYHIVSQLGMMVTALGIGSELGIDASIAHLITNVLYKGTLLMGAGAIVYCTGKSKITELSGMARKMPLTAVCFLISSLAIAGLPFTSGFASKALIMEALETAGLDGAGWLLTVAGVGTLLSITLKINYFVFFSKGNEDIKLLNKPPVSISIAMILSTLVTLFIGFAPTCFYSILPYGSTTNPWTTLHILEYLAIFLGGSIPFILYVRKMKPHDEISLDFDWFYRKPLKALVNAFSKASTAVFGFFEKIVHKSSHELAVSFVNPYKRLKSSRIPYIKNLSLENESHAIGDTISAIVFILTIIIVVAIAI